MKKIWLLFIILVPLLTAVSCKKAVIPDTPSIIPKPVFLELGHGYFQLTDGLTIRIENNASREVEQVASYLSDYLGKAIAFVVPVTKDIVTRDVIFLKINPSLSVELGNEGYVFTSSKTQIIIEGSSASGLFYGVQTLFQLLPAGIYSRQTRQDLDWKIPALTIHDHPHYAWRGMHLDVSRHFFPKEFVKKYIDLIAMHKMNIFHWHLTDDNGWRIEIKKYPLLTDIAAWRVDREDKPWGGREQQKPGEPATYGGFYTQDEIREIVQYAADRRVTIIPEIEMPGHSSEVFAAYPEYSCRGEKLTVQPGSYWPNTDIFCAGKEGTFQFLEDVLAEVAGLFPAPYIHIGGDEADKARWKKCPLCQQRIRDEGLQDEDELQSYFIRRIEKVLQANGKKLIGWDEILEGGLAPEATVMSWRGFEGGIEAARQGHDVIMCPTSHCYFDYYQGDPETEPVAIGGYITLKKVYSFRPTHPVLSPEEARHVLGAQGNVWTEYIPTPEHAEYMAVPRMSALAEVLWSPDRLLDWNDFRKRLPAQFERFNQANVNYSEGSFKVIGLSSFNGSLWDYSIVLEAEAPGAEIHFTTDNSVPSLASSLYEGPLKVTSDMIVLALAFKDGKARGEHSIIPVSYHKAIGMNFTWGQEPSYKYPGESKYSITDGLHGSDYFNDGKWIGFYGDDLDITLDFGEMISTRHIEASFLHDQRRWIFLPEKVVFYFSEDGINYTNVSREIVDYEMGAEEPVIYPAQVELDEPVSFRYIRLQAVNKGVCPDWHPGAGAKSWIFADEIIIR